MVVRTPPDVSLYHRRSNPLFPQVLERLGHDESVHAIVLPRTAEQRDFVRGLALPSVLVPDRAVDGQSLIALADVVVSAGGTMNREAVALGVPGLHDLRRPAGRRRRDADPRGPPDPPQSTRGRSTCASARPKERVRRDPAEMLELLLGGLVAPRGARAVALELRRADPRDRRQLADRAGPAGRDLGQRRVVEDDVRGNLVSPSSASDATP